MAFNPREELAVFRESDATTFLLDRVQLNVYPDRAGFPPKPKFEPTPEALNSLPKDKLVRRDSRWYVELQREGLGLFLSLGHYRGGDGGLGSTVTGNVIVRLRERLAREGLLPRVSPPASASEGRSNFIAPESVPAGLDLHALALQELWGIAGDASSVYRDGLKEVFGLTLPGAKVGVSVCQLELTWDRPCAIARHLSTGFLPSFRSVFYGASVRYPKGERGEVALDEATEGDESGALPGTGILRAKGVKGGGVKLYWKTPHHLRFEYEPTGDRARSLLGHSIRLSDERALAEDLERLAVAPYSLLLSAQEAMTSPVLPHLAALFTPFGVTGQPILAAFLAGEKFHNAGGRFRKTLVRLRDLGLVRHVHRGTWGPTPCVARTFEFFRVRSSVAGARP